MHSQNMGALESKLECEATTRLSHVTLFPCSIGVGVIYEGPRPLSFKLSYLIGGKCLRQPHFTSH